MRSKLKIIPAHLFVVFCLLEELEDRRTRLERVVRLTSPETLQRVLGIIIDPKEDHARVGVVLDLLADTQHHVVVTPRDLVVLHGEVEVRVGLFKLLDDVVLHVRVIYDGGR